MIRTITGLFDTLDDAQRAAKELLHHGIPREDVRMEARDAIDPHAANGVRRGGVLLTMRIDSAMAERVDVDGVLRHYRAVDIDQRRASWHATGWGGAMVADAAHSGFAQGERLRATRYGPLGLRSG